MLFLFELLLFVVGVMALSNNEYSVGRGIKVYDTHARQLGIIAMLPFIFAIVFITGTILWFIMAENAGLWEAIDFYFSDFGGLLWFIELIILIVCAIMLYQRSQKFLEKELIRRAQHPEQREEANLTISDSSNDHDNPYNPPQRF